MRGDIGSDPVGSTDTDDFETVLVQTSSKIVDRRVGMRSDKRRVRDLPVQFEQFYGFDDGACFTGTRWLHGKLWLAR